MKPGCGIVVLIGIALSAPALASGMKVDPGKWEFRSSSMQGGEQVSVECVTQTEMSPELFLKDSQGCTLADAKSDASSMQFKMSCASPGGKMTGEARFESTGKAIEGTMAMAMNVAGRQMTFERSWTGKRIGDCD